MKSFEKSLSTVIQPSEAPDAGVRVSLGPPREVMLAPEGDRRWGMFMFPSLWRMRDGRLICAVTIGEDEMPSDADYHYLWFVSDDGSKNWTLAVVSDDEARAFIRERVTLSDGTQLWYAPKIVSLDRVGVPPYRAEIGRAHV